MEKLRWIEIEGIKYVADYEDDYDHCARCVLNHELRSLSAKYCKQVDCSSNIFIELEPQHIPHLRKVGKTKWLD
jgi:hypothetical protein